MSEPYRKGDTPLGTNKPIAIVTPPQGRNEDRLIETLIGLDENYQDDVRYFPKPGPGSVTYNSNSYVMGLIQAAGATVPKLSPKKYPGCDKPLPTKHFNPPDKGE